MTDLYFFDVGIAVAMPARLVVGRNKKPALFADVLLGDVPSANAQPGDVLLEDALLGGAQSGDDLPEDAQFEDALLEGELFGEDHLEVFPLGYAPTEDGVPVGVLFVDAQIVDIRTSVADNILAVEMQGFAYVVMPVAVVGSAAVDKTDSAVFQMQYYN